MIGLNDTYLKNPIDRRVQNHLLEAYRIITCSNGRYSSPRLHDAVWKEFNDLAIKLFNGLIKER